MSSNPSRVGVLVPFGVAIAAGVSYLLFGRSSSSQPNQQPGGVAVSGSGNQVRATLTQANKQVMASSGGLLSPTFSHSSDSSHLAHVPVHVTSSPGATTSFITGHNHGSVHTAGRDLVYTHAAASSLPALLALGGTALASVGYGAYLFMEAELGDVLHNRPTLEQDSRLLRWYVKLNRRSAKNRLEKRVEGLFNSMTKPLRSDQIRRSDWHNTWPTVQYIMQLSPESVERSMPDWIHYFVQNFLLHDGPEPPADEATIGEFQRCWEQWAKALNRRQVFGGRGCESVGDIVRAGPWRWTPSVLMMMRWLWNQGARMLEEGEWDTWEDIRDCTLRMESVDARIKARVHSMETLFEDRREANSCLSRPHH